jgi:hypothetical protein
LGIYSLDKREAAMMNACSFNQNLALCIDSSQFFAVIHLQEWNAVIKRN